MNDLIQITLGVVFLCAILLFLSRNWDGNNQTIAFTRTLMYRIVVIGFIIAFIASMGKGCDSIFNEDSDFKMR